MKKSIVLLTALILLSACSLSAAAITVTVSSPVNGATTTSPVHFAASAASSRTITGWRIYVDSVSAYQAGQTRTISTNLAMSSGTHQVIVRAWNSTGRYASASLTVKVAQPATTVAISIAPATATLQTGVSQQFTASVTGTTNTAVSWYVNGVQGGNSTVGTISAAGLYTAPASVPSGGTATVTAKSLADTTKLANATVTINAAPAAVKVSLSPLAPTVQTGTTTQFTSTVTGTTNTAVRWLVNGVQGGNTTVGTISSTGLYAAPATVPSGAVTVTATSSYDSTASATTTVSVVAASTPVAVSISPTSASVQAAGTKQFTASVTGTTNTSVTWLVNGVQSGNSTVGTVSATGLYTAPTQVPSGGSATVTARSAYDSTKSASATVTVTTSNVNHYYVSTTGSDANNGLSPQTAWATINHADATAAIGAGGTIIHVAPGTYSQAVTTNKSGTSATARLVFRSDSRWGAKLNAPSGLGAWNSNGAWVDIVGFDITGASAVRFGIISTNNHVRALSNYIHDLSNGNTANAGAGFGQNNYSITDQQVIGNIIVRIGPNAGTTFTGLVHGIYFSTPSNIAKNNVVAQISGYGIHLWHGATQEIITNNTVIGSLDGGIINGSGDSPCTVNSGTIISNNILVANAVGIKEGTSGGCTVTGATYANNLFYNNSTNWGTISSPTTGTVLGDPKFVNYQFNGTGDYHLQSGSAAIDKGTSSNAPTVDLDGGARPQGAGFDIGPYEYGSTPAIWPWQ